MRFMEKENRKGELQKLHSSVPHHHRMLRFLSLVKGKNLPIKTPQLISLWLFKHCARTTDSAELCLAENQVAGRSALLPSCFKQHLPKGKFSSQGLPEFIYNPQGAPSAGFLAALPEEALGWIHKLLCELVYFLASSLKIFIQSKHEKKNQK